MRHRAAVAAAAALLAAGCGGDDGPQATAPPEPPPDLLEPRAGTTVFRPSERARQMMRLVDARLEPIPPAERRHGGIAFPVTGGSVDLDDLSGTVEHAGGVRLVQGGRTGRVLEPTLSLSQKALTADVNGTRTTVLGLDLAGADVERRGGTLLMRDAPTRLSEDVLERLRRRLGPAGTLGLRLVEDSPAGTLSTRAMP